MLMFCIYHSIGYYIQGVQQHGCSNKQKNRKLRIEKIGKIGNFVLKNRRKIGKSIVLFLTKIESLHHIRVIIKAMSPQLLCLQDLDQLSQVRRRENDQQRLVYWLRTSICFSQAERGSIIEDDHMQIPFKLAANL